MKIFAIDPGGVTGWAFADTEDRDGTLKYGQVDARDSGVGEVECARRLVRWVIASRSDLVVIESFTLRVFDQKRDLLSPVRLTAMIEYGLAVAEFAGELKTNSSPSDAKGLITDERLKRWGYWVKGMQHSRDAIRHLLLAERRYNSSPVKQ